LGDDRFATLDWMPPGRGLPNAYGYRHLPQNTGSDLVAILQLLAIIGVLVGLYLYFF
jgi:hypothetical protein